MDIVERLRKGLSADGIQAHKEALILLPEAATEIERLRAELAELKKQEAHVREIGWNLVAERDALVEKLRLACERGDVADAELAACRGDAERYRWLRDYGHWPAAFQYGSSEPLREQFLDDAIDAARKGGA